MEKSSTHVVTRKLFDSPLKIVLIYFLVSAIWIYLSDSIVYTMVADPSLRYNISLVKGTVFILLTSVLLFYLVKKGFDSLRSSEASLHKSERRIRVMIERAPYGIIESEETGKIVRANIKANEILGTSTDELIGANLKDFVVRSTDIIRTPEQRTQPASHDGVSRFSRKNGKPIWVQRISTPITDGDESERYVLEMIQDVTEQKESTIQLARRAEELEALYGVSRKIIESELALESLVGICSAAVEKLHASSALVYHLSPTGEMETIAQNGEAPDFCVDLKNDRTITGDSIRTVDTPNESWAIVPLVENDKTVGAMVFGHREQGWFDRQRLIPFRSLANLSLLSIQKVRMIDALRSHAISLEDKVSERTQELTELSARLSEEVKRTREAQERLFQEKEMLDMTLHSIGEGVVVTDMGGVILMANQIAEETNAAIRPIIGHPIYDILPILDPLTEQLVENYWVARDLGGISERKGIVMNLDGKRDYSYNSAVVRDRSGAVMGYVIVFRDITDDVRLQKAVAEAQRFESIGQLAGGIAHSYNNILTSILGNIEMLSYAELDASRRNDCLEDARQATIKAKDLSNQLLTFAKGGEPIKKNVSVLDILNGIVEKLSGKVQIDIEVSLERDRYVVNADEVQMGLAFSSLMNNALTSGPKGVTMDVSLSYEGVSVPGIGSNAPTRYVVVNIEAMNTTQRMGTDGPAASGSPLDEKQGLDLAIANSIIRRHDGFMTMGSSEKGSDYKVFLLARSECAPVASALPGRRMDRAAKVLVMDDDEDVLDVVTGMVEALGHKAVAAKDGSEAIELFAQADASGEPFDVVIMDLNIPGGVGGRETIRRLQERYTNVKAIVSSGYSNDPITANFISYGFKGVLPKPYTMKQLEDAIQNALADV